MRTFGVEEELLRFGGHWRVSRHPANKLQMALLPHLGRECADVCDLPGAPKELQDEQADALLLALRGLGVNAFLERGTVVVRPGAARVEDGKTEP